jgi:glucose-6-phosphate isomerase
VAANPYTNRRLSARYPADLRAWQALKAHYADMKKRELSQLFARDGSRAERFSLSAGNLLLDYSKNHVNSTTRKLFARLAKEAGVPAAIEAMFGGELINETEGRSVLHAALRSKISDQVALETPGVRDVWKVLSSMEEFVEAVHSGSVSGSTSRRLTDIVNIGIGGSDLGPVMASKALKPYWKVDMRFHSVSNVDGTQLDDLIDELNPETTLFVVCSKTFTTLETMTNGHANGSSRSSGTRLSNAISWRPRPTTRR